MFTIDYADHITLGPEYFRLFAVIVAVILVYFLSFQLQTLFYTFIKKLSEKIGIYANDKEYELQRYVYQHNNSLLTKFYRFVNEQLIALGMKRLGVTVVGYVIFWGFSSFIIATVITYISKMGILAGPFIWALTFTGTMIMTRVFVSERMEKREADVMNAIDLIVPEVGNGIKNAIVMYQDNFAPSVREDFKAFINNIQDRGFTFEAAMYILADNLGVIFNDFAQKSIYFESVGEKEMQEIFVDISETNRLRRQLRDENDAAFAGLKTTFIISTLMTFGYFLFVVFTDQFSRYFFLNSIPGKILLVIMVMTVFLVLSYISTIKSRAI